MSDFLARVIAQKQHEVSAMKQRTAKSLKAALRTPRAIIAEIKRTSPANGPLSLITDPVSLALTYQAAGAAAISVLTDSTFFNGSINDLRMVSAALKNTPCVILRKEFIIDEIQLVESALAGADAVLLIVAVLKDNTQAMIDKAHELGLEVLLEAHTADELTLALTTDADVIGINNRDLTTLKVDTHTSIALHDLFPKHVISVSESGIHDAKTAHQLFELGYHALLIGEALVTSPNPAELIPSMRGL